MRNSEMDQRLCRYFLLGGQADNIDECYLALNDNKLPYAIH